MNAIQSTLSSARFNRYLLWLGVAVLAAGALVLVVTLAGGSDKTKVGPEKGFKPTLLAKTTPLKNADGITIKTFGQLDPQIRSTIRTFIATAVARRHLDQSWAVVAPSMRAGYTYRQWKAAKALPVVPYQFDNINRVQYYLDYASSKEILIEVGLSAKRKFHIRPTTFQIGLIPVGQSGAQRWLVNYWMPRWTPPIPTN
jgi:hypothetical protein